jgi:hypothetical protein
VKDRDQIVDEIIVRMTPWQFETRCTHNTVHFVLNEQQRRNPFWNQPATLTLLGKGPKFIPKARPLTSKEVLGACARLNYRMVRAFERFIRRDRYEHMKALQRECGIQDWFPKQRSLTTEYCRTYVKGFFRCSDAYGPWGGNQLLSPYFDRSISNIERDIIAVAAAAKKSLSARHRWPNITKVEQSVIMQMRELDVGYNTADKNLGAVVYSKDLFKEQCLMHLEDSKGTYRKIEDQTKEDILDDIFLKLRLVLLPFKKHGLGWANIAESIIRDSKNALNKGKLCNFYIIWKLHKAASASGLRSRPIAAALDYVTGPASHFLHCQLKEAVWKHPHVLKDSLELIRIVRELQCELQFGAEEQIMLTAADVNALYPSINLERGMDALKWFMDNHTCFNQTLKDLCLKLAFFVLTNNYVECKQLGRNIYLQMIGTAMGTSFSVIYAIIFMIRLESSIVNDVRFSQYIRLYKRFIDDLFLIWTGPADVLCDFRRSLATADEAISLDWSGYVSQQDSVTPSTVATKRHDQVVFLDLDMSLQSVRARTGTTLQVQFRPYHKPGNAFAYIPFNSFHGRHTFRGWVLAESMRLLTHSSTPDIWKEEATVFYRHLCSRGYPRNFLRAVLQEVTWARRSELLAKNRQRKCQEFFETYRACILSFRNAPEWPMLKNSLDLSLDQLRESTFGDIFPSRIFLTQSNAPRLGSILRR